MKLITKQNEQRAVKILEGAFQDDPFMSWLFPGLDSGDGLFQLMTPVFREPNIAYMTDEQDGVAIWVKPGEVLKLPMSFKNLIRFIRAAGWMTLIRFNRLMLSSRNTHPEVPHYYLFMIAKDPAASRKGVGSELMEHMLKRCDEENVPAYLENSNPQNLPFYEKHGFKVQTEKAPAKNAPMLWYMIRKPIRNGGWSG